MKTKTVILILLLFLLSPVASIVSLIWAGYFFCDTLIFPFFFLIIFPFLVVIFTVIKFGKTFLRGLIIFLIYILTSILFIVFRPLPQNIHLKAFKYRCTHTFDYIELEQFRKLIELKYNKGSLKIEDNFYKSDCFINSVSDSLLIKKEKRFWSGLRYYIPELEKNEYIKKHFVEVGLDIEDGEVKEIYFFINDNLWALVYQRSYPSPPYVLSRKQLEIENMKNRKFGETEIFENYYGFKR